MASKSCRRKSAISVERAAADALLCDGKRFDGISPDLEAAAEQLSALGLIRCERKEYVNIPGKTGPVLFNCSGDHPTGSGPICTGDGGSWYCGYGAQCYEQSGQYTIT